jgi:hypothetical protein
MRLWSMMVPLMTGSSFLTSPSSRTGVLLAQMSLALGSFALMAST